jgi:alcohol dehydrogenase (cytochrome c)
VSRVERRGVHQFLLFTAGELQAWDPATGKKVWQHNFPKSQLFGSVLATAGDLVFAGGTNDRNFRAFNAKTGQLPWEQKTNSGIMGMPVSYEVDGTIHRDPVRLGC